MHTTLPTTNSYSSSITAASKCLLMLSAYIFPANTNAITNTSCEDISSSIISKSVSWYACNGNNRVAPECYYDTQIPNNLDQGEAEVFFEFYNKLTSNMKTLPSRFLEDIAQRPWDFI